MGTHPTKGALNREIDQMMNAGGPTTVDRRFHQPTGFPDGGFTSGSTANSVFLIRFSKSVLNIMTVTALF